MPFTELVQDYNLDTAEYGTKHYRDGWINLTCPFCSDVIEDRHHLGYNLDNMYFHCWRCGKHSLHDSLSKLLNLPIRQVNELIKTYQLNEPSQSQSRHIPVEIQKVPFKVPTGVVDLGPPHKKYLRKRKFSPTEIQKEWSVQGTSPFSVLITDEKKISYKYRIFIPIIWDGKVVSFQCRDYTEKQDKRYMACPIVREKIHHKHIIYAHEEALQRDEIICVEGILDVWRFRRFAGCTFGIQYTSEQVKVLSKFKRVHILFDPGRLAQKQAKQLSRDLQWLGTSSVVHEPLETDPGAMDQKEADYLVKQIIG